MRKCIGLAIFALALLLHVGPASANKSATAIEGPTSVTKGTEVTLRITVTHNANTASHHTEWLKVMANKKEIARWDFTRDRRPEAAEFTREIRMTVTEDMEIVAEASCNIHGSRGPAIHKISVKE